MPAPVGSAEGAPAPSNPNLHALLFEENEALGAGQEGVALGDSIVTPSGNVFTVDKTRPWPAMVPEEQAGIAILLGRAQCQGLEELTREILKEHGPIEEAAMRGEQLPIDAGALRSALVMRWRQAVALYCMPAPGGQMSKSALDTLLNEADAVMQRLVVPEGVEGPMAESITKIRAHLARDVMVLAKAESELIRRLTNPEIPAVGVAKKAAAKIITYAADVKREPKKKLPVVFAVCMAIGGLFHGVNFLLGLRDIPPPAMDPAIPAGFTGHKDSTSGNMVIGRDPSKPYTAAELETLKAEAAKAGKVLRMVGPSEVLLNSETEAPIP